MSKNKFSNKQLRLGAGLAFLFMLLSLGGLILDVAVAWRLIIALVWLFVGVWIFRNRITKI